MNECPLLGSGRGGVNVQLWVKLPLQLNLRRSMTKALLSGVKNDPNRLHRCVPNWKVAAAFEPMELRRRKGRLCARSLPWQTEPIVPAPADHNAASAGGGGPDLLRSRC